MLSAARPRLIAIKAARPFSSNSYVSSDSQVDRFPTSENGSSEPEPTSSPRPDRRHDYRDFVPRKPIPQNLTPGDYYTYKNGEWEDSGPLPQRPQTRMIRTPVPKKTSSEKEMAPTEYTWRDNSWSASPEQKKYYVLRRNKSAERFPASYFPDPNKAIRLGAPEGMEPVREGVQRPTFTLLPEKRLMRHIPPTVPRREGVPLSVEGGENAVVKSVQEAKRKYIESYERVPLRTLVAEMMKRGIGKNGTKIEVVNKLERDDIANMIDQPYLTDAPVVLYPKVNPAVYKKAGWVNHRPVPTNDRRGTGKRSFATLPSSIPKPTLQYSDPPIFPRLWTPPAETPIKVPHLQKYIPQTAAVVRPSIYPTERHYSEPPVLPKLHVRPVEREIRVPFLFTYVGTGKYRPAVNTTVEGSSAVSAGTFGVNVKELVKPKF
ncbi:hypothetical protein BZA77DRAFT_320207 [Pyronema omphalodes]|nr:hypothetical protein BZA77DRAFT_320207 [Pyronema omphalodes]